MIKFINSLIFKRLKKKPQFNILLDTINKREYLKDRVSSSGYTGVTFKKDINKYRSYFSIHKNGSRIRFDLGNFDNVKEAKLARDIFIDSLR